MNINQVAKDVQFDYLFGNSYSEVHEEVRKWMEGGNEFVIAIDISPNDTADSSFKLCAMIMYKESN